MAAAAVIGGAREGEGSRGWADQIRLGDRRPMVSLIGAEREEGGPGRKLVRCPWRSLGPRQARGERIGADCVVEVARMERVCPGDWVTRTGALDARSWRIGRGDRRLRR